MTNFFPKRPRLNDDERRGDTLFGAAGLGDEEAVRKMLALDPHLITMTLGSWTALHHAAYYGQVNIVTLLLSQCPTLIDVTTWDGLTALHLAAENNHTGVVLCLIAQSPNLTKVTCDRLSALHLAAQAGQEEVVALFLAQSPAMMDMVTSSGKLALHCAAQSGHEKVVAQLLAQRPDQLDTTNFSGWSSLHFAAEDGHDKVVDLLLARGSTMIDARASDRWTPLYSAARCNHTKVVERLLLAKPSLVKSLDPQCNSLLHALLSVGVPDQQLVEKVWRMHPEALRSANEYAETPFDVALLQEHEWAVAMFQNVLCLDEVIMAFREADRSLELLMPEVTRHCVTLHECLHRDLVDAIYEYLGIHHRGVKRKEAPLTP